MFLTSGQIEQLTGYRKPVLQIRWLLANGYHIDVRADGRPAVLTAQVEARQLQGLAKPSRATEEPDFDSLRS